MSGIRCDDQDSLDIIFPAHNEAERIGPTLHAYRREFAHPHVRFIVALDDCEDGTRDVVDRHTRVDPRVEAHAFPKLGKGGVIRQAFAHCRADWVAFVDADGSIGPDQFVRLVHAARDADGAIASRRLPTSAVRGHRIISRRAASAMFAWLVRRLFALAYRDTQCGAKLIRREVLQRLLSRVSTNDLLFDLDLLLRADELGYRVVEVPTVWVSRPGSKVRLLRDLGDVTGSLLRLWRSRRKLGSLAVTMADQLDRGRHVT
ncbi:MAG TPA: glycosyltransferase [Acidimicrobiia bacterium]|nr:glycosyltransferase [Acidimicrobiia bacterium]